MNLHPLPLSNKTKENYPKIAKAFNKAFCEEILGNPEFDNCSKDDIDLNITLLNQITLNAIADIDRMQTFHLDKLNSGPDRHKYSGFLSRWVTKLKPIQLKPKRTNNPHLSMINAYYATFIFLGFLIKGDKKIDFKGMQALYYQFHFRDTSGEQLALLAYYTELAMHKEETVKRRQPHS